LRRYYPDFATELRDKAVPEKKRKEREKKEKRRKDKKDKKE